MTAILATSGRFKDHFVSDFVNFPNSQATVGGPRPTSSKSPKIHFVSLTPARQPVIARAVK